MSYVFDQKKLLRLWVFLAISFVLLALFVNLMTMVIFGKSLDWHITLYHPLVYTLWVLFVPVVFTLYKYIPFQGNSYVFFAKHLALGLLLCVVHRLLVELSLAYILIQMDPGKWAYLSPNDGVYLFAMRVLIGAIQNLFLYVITLAIVMSLWFEGRFHDEAVLRARAEKGKVLAELEALKMQVQPHFLFNAFNNLSSLIEEDQAEAQDYLGRLGELLHHALDHQIQDMVTVEDEAAFAENYLAIQAVRFSDRMQVHQQTAAELLHKKVPVFLLQPLIENTIKHAVSVSPGPHVIEIVIAARRSRICIDVTNTWQDQMPEQETKGHGIGLSALRKRLALLYPDDFVMDVNASQQCFNVHIELPGGAP